MIKKITLVASILLIAVACSSNKEKQIVPELAEVNHRTVEMPVAPVVVEEPVVVEQPVVEEPVVTGPTLTLYEENALTSWYGGKYYNGRKTASGAIYDDSLLTAAHRKLPFGTKVRVVNKDNGKYVDVVINDRGPYIKGRTLDLSKAAFAEILDINKGLGRFDVYIIGE